MSLLLQRTFLNSCLRRTSFTIQKPLITSSSVRPYCSSNPKKDPISELNAMKAKDKSWKIPITWRSLSITAAVGMAGLCFMWYLRNAKDKALEKDRRRVLGKAKIGGRFDLIDHNGKAVSSDDLLGQWLLIYFGFTHCPDICPDELEKLATVVDNIDNDKNVPNIQPLFITVDPNRDTADLIKKYVGEFHPKFLGLTGSVEKIAEACKSYRVYFSAGPMDEDEDYIVDHTIIIYLVDPSGAFVDYFGQNKDAESITDGIVLNMCKYNMHVKK